MRVTNTCCNRWDKGRNGRCGRRPRRPFRQIEAMKTPSIRRSSIRTSIRRTILRESLPRQFIRNAIHRRTTAVDSGWQRATITRQAPSQFRTSVRYSRHHLVSFCFLPLPRAASMQIILVMQSNGPHAHCLNDTRTHQSFGNPYDCATH